MGMGSNREMIRITPKVLICATDYRGLKCTEISTLEEGQIWGTDEKKEYKISFGKVLLNYI